MACFSCILDCVVVMTIPPEELERWLVENLKGQGLTFPITDEQSIEKIIILLKSLDL